jgi:glycosyltransferase involved in cell wall biosynthesis
MAQVHYDLSVVTVVLNDKHGLEKTIRAVQDQRFINIQHIIVDGGSWDGSALLAMKHSTVALTSMADGGIYPAMQRGAAVATGKFLLFCNAGDLIFGRDYLHKAIELFSSSDSDWGYGPIIELTERNTSVWVPANPDPTFHSIVSRKDFVPFPSFIVKRELFASVGGFTTKYKIAGDFELICKVAQNRDPIIFDDPIALFSAGGISYTKADRAWIEEILIRREILNLGRLKILREMAKFCLRFTKWKLGKFLDIVEKILGISSVSWRDRRAHKVPAKYVPELSQ